MELIDNIQLLLGDDIEEKLVEGGRVSCAPASFSICAFEALRVQLVKLDRFEFVFTGPSFVTRGGRVSRAHQEFIIPSMMQRRDVTGTPFENRLRNKLFEMLKFSTASVSTHHRRRNSLADFVSSKWISNISSWR